MRRLLSLLLPVMAVALTPACSSLFGKQEPAEHYTRRYAASLEEVHTAVESRARESGALISRGQVGDPIRIEFPSSSDLMRPPSHVAEIVLVAAGDGTVKLDARIVERAGARAPFSLADFLAALDEDLAGETLDR